LLAVTFAAPAFAVPVDVVGFAAPAFAAVGLAVFVAGVNVAVLVPVRSLLLLVVVVPAARFAAGLVVALLAAAIVSFPLVSEISACRFAGRHVRRACDPYPSQRASSASQVSLRSRTRSSACPASSAELYGPSRSTAGQMFCSVSTR
jgi:hypothetical protein